MSMKKESPQEKVNRLELELNQAKQELEDSKPKVGQWVVSNINNCVFRYIPDRVTDDLEIITDKKLIKKLDDLIKEEFVLPEKWFLRFYTEDVYNYFNKNKGLSVFYPNSGITSDKDIEKYDLSGDFSYLPNYKIKEDYTEITFEQFKKYVMNGTNR